MEHLVDLFQWLCIVALGLVLKQTMQRLAALKEDMRMSFQVANTRVTLLETKADTLTRQMKDLDRAMVKVQERAR